MPVRWHPLRVWPRSILLKMCCVRAHLGPGSRLRHLLNWYNRCATTGKGLVSRGRFLLLWLAQGPAVQQRERDMTVEALTGAHAGASEEDAVDPSDDLYETA